MEDLQHHRRDYDDDEDDDDDNGNNLPDLGDVDAALLNGQQQSIEAQLHEEQLNAQLRNSQEQQQNQS